MAALLSFMSVSGILGWLNIKGDVVDIVLPEEVYCGLETLITVRMVNRRRYFASFLLRVDLLGGTAVFDLVERGAEAKSSFTGVFRERGMHLITEGVISSPFPVNFFVRSRRVPIDTRIVVFPAPRPAQVPTGHDRPGLTEAQAAAARGYEGDLSKISDYTGAEPLKLIHWRLSARHDQLKVKELTASTQTPVVLDMEAMQGGNIEENLSRCVYLVNRMVRSGRPVGLKLGERIIPPGNSRDHRLRLLTELAEYGKN